jgi:NADP-dependent 3-hydroxy acid dehydrogenase YdfG
MDLSDNITGKIIVITGASSGLGETTARHLASKSKRSFRSQTKKTS